MADVRSFSWLDVPVESILDGVSRQRISGDTFTVIRYTYQPGSVFPVHSHPEEQITIIHSGEIEFWIGDQLQVLREGMLAVIPGDVPHGAQVLGDIPVVSDNFIASAQRSELSWEEPK